MYFAENNNDFCHILLWLVTLLMTHESGVIKRTESYKYYTDFLLGCVRNLSRLHIFLNTHTFTEFCLLDTQGN